MHYSELFKKSCNKTCYFLVLNFYSLSSPFFPMLSGNNPVGTVGTILVIVGALNWGLIGLGGFLAKDLNVVNMLLGAWPMVEWVVYVLVGLAGVWMVLSELKVVKG